jgi:hypothetical protein
MRAFRDAIESRDIEALMALFSDEIVFRSPVVYKPYGGREQMRAILTATAGVLEGFTYTKEIGGPTGPDYALVFEARIGDLAIEGCDFIHTNDEGQIDEMFVMVRPLSGQLALAEAMGRQLREQRRECIHS